jgi:hypothetical protein
MVELSQWRQKTVNVISVTGSFLLRMLGKVATTSFNDVPSDHILIAFRSTLQDASCIDFVFTERMNAMIRRGHGAMESCSKIHEASYNEAAVNVCCSRREVKPNPILTLTTDAKGLLCSQLLGTLTVSS